MIKKIAFAFILLFVTSIVTAQKLTQFSSDSIKYIKELNEYFYDFSANKKDAEEYVANFQKIWKSPDFSSKYRAAIYKTSNVMLQRKLKPYPYFISYLNAVVNFINSKQNPEVFDNWQLCIEKIFNSKNLKNYGDLFVGVNKVGNSTSSALKVVVDEYSTEKAILVFLHIGFMVKF